MESNRSDRLTEASKANPCPHCGKPDWCYSVGELTVCKRQEAPGSGWEITSKSDAEGTPYYAPVQEKKAIRPKKHQHWDYTDRAGSPLIRVSRFDNGEGGGFNGGKKPSWGQYQWAGDKWITGTEGIAPENIPIYKYSEIRKAIAENQLIFVPEGESCADALWDLGLAATTNIGGAGKWRPSHSEDLRGAKIVIVPDRDVPGIAHADRIAQDFPEALWLYPFPGSAWNNPPKSKGLDVADWISGHNLTAEDILAAVGERKQVKEPEVMSNESKVVSHPKFEAPDLENLKIEIDELLNADLKRSDLHLKFAELARQYRLSSSEISKAYYLKAEEAEREADRPDVAAEIEALLNAHKSSIALSEVLPIGLAAPIEKLAKMLDLRPECYLTALLAQTSSLFKVGTETMLRRDTDWRCVPNYFAGIVGESSVAKSPIPKAIIDRPMRSLREKAKQEFEQAQANYESELSNWKAAKKEEDRGPAPKAPRLRVYSFDKTTGEGIIYQQAEHSEQALMYFCDELAGLFKSANQYRGGKGSDEEDLLSFWNGSGTTVLRASGVRASLDAVGLSIFGTIQPDVLAYLLKDCSDSNGKFARFDFVFQPLTASDLPEEDGARFDLTPMLTDLYAKIDALPAIFFELDREAKKYFTIFRNACKRRQVAEPKQGLRAAIGKMPEKVGKLATTIHTLTCIFEGQPMSNHIPRSAVEAAVKFVKFAADQVASLYTEFSDRTALAPNLAKILLLAERKGGTVSVRDAQRSFGSRPPAAQQIKEWFDELSILGYGVKQRTTRSFNFQLSTVDRPPLTLTMPTYSSNLVPEPVTGVDTRMTVSGSCATQTNQLPLTAANCQRSVDKLKPLPQEELRSTATNVNDFDTCDRETIDECVSFIRSAIAENCTETAKSIQAVLVEMAPVLKPEIWNQLTADEKAEFKKLLTADTDSADNSSEPSPVEEHSADNTTDKPLTVADSCTQLEQELLAIADLQEFSDFADWLGDAQQLENLCCKLGGQPLLLLKQFQRGGNLPGKQ